MSLLFRFSDTNYRAGVIIDKGKSFTIEINDTGFIIYTIDNLNIATIRIKELNIF